MSKGVIVIICLTVFAICALVFIRIAHLVDVYRVPSMSSAPTYFPGSSFTASSLNEPDTGKFICFRKEDKKEIWFSRCVAKSGDIVEIKDAKVYVNGRSLNEPYTWNEYYISQKELDHIQGYVNQYNYPLQPLHDSLYSITFSANDEKKYQLNLKPVIAPKGEVDSQLFAGFATLKYNRDNFGPIKIPKDDYFVLGDNRHDAFDSRYIGFIKKDEVVSTAFK